LHPALSHTISLTSQFPRFRLACHRHPPVISYFFEQPGNYGKRRSRGHVA